MTNRIFCSRFLSELEPDTDCTQCPECSARLVAPGAVIGYQEYHARMEREWEAAERDGLVLRKRNSAV